MFTKSILNDFYRDERISFDLNQNRQKSNKV